MILVSGCQHLTACPGEGRPYGRAPFLAAAVPAPRHQPQQRGGDMSLKTLTCYGEVYLTHVPESRAKSLAEEHIRTCPQGAMPWATSIEWHSTDDGVLCSAQGSWLDHHIRPNHNEEE